jgi:23S rRNA (cytidine1920-2'-O)/16S rRNA (cytidine1409-2'-O)-methyltransferase
VTSPLPGPSGNVEFFVWLRRGPAAVDDARLEAVVSAGTTSVPGEKVEQ